MASEPGGGEGHSGGLSPNFNFHSAPVGVEKVEGNHGGQACLVWTAPACPAVQAESDISFLRLHPFAPLTMDILRQSEICFTPVGDFDIVKNGLPLPDLYFSLTLTACHVALTALSPHLCLFTSPANIYYG